MNVLIVSQYFWPESFLINSLAVDLVNRGHDVAVLTGLPNYPGGKLFSGYGYLNHQEDYHGVKIHRVPLVPRGRGGGLRLVLNYLSFAVSASFCGPLLLRRQEFDLIFVFEPSPITVGIPALLLKRIKSAPVVFWVQDLWPESLSATGAVTSRMLLASVERLVRYIYRRCDRILIQSRSFFDSVVQKGGSPDRILYFPNSADTIFHTPLPAAGNSSLPDGFRIMFAGNIGAAQDLGTVISAAKMLQNYKDIHWIIIGDGRMGGWAEAEVLKQGLSDNFHFLGRHPVESMPAFFAQADSLLVTLKKEPIFALTIPAKVQSYLACGRPIIAALDGEASRIIEEAGAGFACPAEDPDSFARAVLKMYKATKSEREEMGLKGRAYYEANFDREMLCGRLEAWMNDLAGESRV